MQRIAPVALALALASAADAHNTNHFVLVDLDGSGTFSPQVMTIEIGDTVQWNFVRGGHNVIAGEAGFPTGDFQSVPQPNHANAAGTTFKVTFDEAFLAAHPAANNMYAYHSAVGPEMTGMVRVLTESDKNPPAWRNVDQSIYAAWSFDTPVAPGTPPYPLMEVGTPPLPHDAPTEVLAVNGGAWVAEMLGHSGVHSMGPDDTISFGFEFWPDAGVRTGRVQYTHTGAQSNHQIYLYIDGEPTPVNTSVATTWWPSGWYHTTLEFLAPGPSDGPHDGRWELVLGGQAVDGLVVDFAMGQQAPLTAGDPHPEHGAFGITASPTLRWAPGVGAISHDVYLGESPDLDADDLRGTVNGTTFEAGALTDGTTYYWRIDAFDGLDTHPGEVWSFTVTEASLGAVGAAIDVGVMAGHQVLMPNGRVLIWEYAQENGPPVAKSYDFDPAAPLGGVTRQAPADSFCSGMTMLSDGRVLATGSIEAEDITAFYDMDTQQWTAGPSMQRERYYPSTIVLGDGALLTMGGLNPEDHELSVEMAAADAASWSLVGGQSMPEQGEEGYPRLHLLSDGRVFMSGQSPRSYIFDPTGGTWTQVAQTNYPRWRAEAPSVRLLDGRILVFGGWDLTMNSGGTLQVTSTTEIIDPEAENPTWQTVGNLAGPRQLHDGVLLPDGTVLCVGGEEEEDLLFSMELFDPNTLQWQTVAAHQDPRSYHATAGLLPDGRVLIGGTDEVTTIEFYSPSYLFAGPRPVIDAAPSSAAWGQQIQVDYTSDDPIASVVLMRPGCITHSFNYNQIGVPLSFNDFGSYVRADIPSNPNLLPPGSYLLFMLSEQGVPAIAPFIKLEPGTPCSGDITGDGVVGPADLASLLDSWGVCGGCAADLDGDGVVGPPDLAALLDAWGQCP